MFIQHKYIAPEHHVALESIVRNHMPMTSLTIARLYRLALAALTSEPKEDRVAVSTLKSEGVVVGTATCLTTGVYIQLALVVGQQRPLLTVGKKWAVEGINTTMGNVSTKFFD